MNKMRSTNTHKKKKTVKWEVNTLKVFFAQKQVDLKTTVSML